MIMCVACRESTRAKIHIFARLAIVSVDSALSRTRIQTQKRLTFFIKTMA